MRERERNENWKVFSDIFLRKVLRAGLVEKVFAFYSDGPSLNPNEVHSFLLLNVALRERKVYRFYIQREKREREREIEKYFWHLFCKKLLRERMTATIAFLQSWKTFFWVASTHVCRLHYYKNFSILIKYEPADQCDQMILS